MERTVTVGVGSKFKFPFPSVNSILNASSVEPLITAINENKKWSISQKLHGCNVAVSSQLYVASRRFVIANAFQENHLSDFTFQKTSLEHLHPLLKKIEHLHTILKNECELEVDFSKDELLIYGEFIVPGTASSKHDVYNYKGQNFKTGHLYAFAVGFVFENQAKSDLQEVELRKAFSNVFRLENEEKKTYFICMINPGNKKLLLHANIDTVEFLKDDLFKNLLVNKKNLAMLENRSLEGFVLHHDSFIFKWKYLKNTSDYHDALLRSFENEIFWDQNQRDVVLSLKTLYNYSNVYLNELDKEAFNKMLKEFVSEELGNFENDLDDCQLPPQKHEIQFACQTWTNFAADFIMHRLLLQHPKKCFFDKEIKMEIYDVVFQKFEMHAWHYLKNCQQTTL